MENKEIIEKLAKEVMGWPFPDNPDKLSNKEEVWGYIKNNKVLMGTPYLLNEDLINKEGTHSKKIYDHSWVKWKPLENMSDTEMVIKRMAEINSLNNLHLIRYSYNRCYAAFGSGSFDELEGAEANGENCMAEAICLAALKLFGE